MIPTLRGVRISNMNMVRRFIVLRYTFVNDIGALIALRCFNQVMSWYYHCTARAFRCCFLVGETPGHLPLLYQKNSVGLELQLFSIV